MPRVLTTNATITCPHGGVGTSMPMPAPRLVTINGGEVLVTGDQGTLSCAFTVPCVGYALVSMGLNATTLEQRAVMLDSDFLQSYTGFPLTVVESHSVFDRTTPGTPPPQGATIPPELQEDDKPTVVVAPPQLPFSVSAFGSTGNPAALPFVFTLTSAYPLKWTLWQVGPPATSLELTSAGLPGLVTVVPTGGTWSTPTLVVSVTVTGAYAATLMPGEHSFVLTGVNRRGFSKYAEAKLTVSA
jgi:hypothetical protein